MTDDAFKVLLELAMRPSTGAFVPLAEIIEATRLSIERVNVALVDLRRLEYVQTLPEEGHSFLMDAMATSRGRAEIERMYAEKKNPAHRDRSRVGNVRLFISHSSADELLARRIADLFDRVLKLPHGSIRCTTVEGYKLKAGADTANQLRDEAVSSDAFVAVLSKSSLRSAFVTFELGARWGARKHIAPLLAPGLRTTDLPSPLDGLHALSTAKTGELHQCLSEVAEELGVELPPSATFQRQLDELATTAAGNFHEEPPDPQIHVFFHDALGQDRDVALRVQELFVSTGWKVERGRTNLPEHAHGLFVKGPSAHRTIAKWGLAQVGLKADDDCSGDTPPIVQVIVGRLSVDALSGVGDLPHGSDRVIQLLSKHQRIPSVPLIGMLKLSETRAQHLFDMLLARELIGASRAVGQVPVYFLTDKGRALAVRLGFA